MRLTSKPFHALTAQDLMSPELVVIPQEMTLRNAAHVLLQAQVSGAPVVDESGRCVGILSSTDFLRWMDEHKRHSAHLHPHALSSEWPVDVERLPSDTVKTYMTQDVVATGPHTSIGQLAEMMLNAHIHRILVVGAQHQPLGIVTSIDILAAVAKSLSGVRETWAGPHTASAFVKPR